MPNRILRDGFVDSEAVNALGDWTHRVYSNLLVKCDDAGRFDGRLEYIRSHLFPLGTARRAEDFRKAVDELSDKALLITYEFGGKPYLQVTKWQRCGNAEQSRYPWRDGDFRISYEKRATRDGLKDFVTTSVSHVDPVKTPSVSHANPIVTGSGSNSIDLNTETETETETNTPLLGSRRRNSDGVDPPGFLRFWESYPPGIRKAARGKCLARWKRHKLEIHADLILATLETYKARWKQDGGKYVSKALKWLEEAPWETDPSDLIEEPSSNGESEYHATPEQIAIARGEIE